MTKKQVALVACSKSKGAFSTEARNLYTGDLFKKSREYVEKRRWDWYIISAKYGVIRPTRVITPYNWTLSNMTPMEKRAWANVVLEQLQFFLKDGVDELVVFAGEAYRDRWWFDRLDVRKVVPLRGLRQGEQLAWFNKRLKQRSW